MQVYPGRDITNIVESSHYQKIGGWCRQGALNSAKCKGAQRWIKPFRCLGKRFRYVLLELMLALPWETYKYLLSISNGRETRHNMFCVQVKRRRCRRKRNAMNCSPVTNLVLKTVESNCNIEKKHQNEIWQRKKLVWMHANHKYASGSHSRARKEKKQIYGRLVDQYFWYIVADVITNDGV